MSAKIATPTAWLSLLNAAIKIPKTKVDRELFIREQLRDICSHEEATLAIEKTPSAVLTSEQINVLADACIKKHTAYATLSSAAAGLPGGAATLIATPIDVGQYYSHVIQLSQKLGYLYGFPDFIGHDGKLNDYARATLTAFIGTMMGVAAANEAVTIIARSIAKNAAANMAEHALLKSLAPLYFKICAQLSVKTSEQSFGKFVSKAIPLAGGIISGGITAFTFYPCAQRLKRRLIEQRSVICV